MKWKCLGQFRKMLSKIEKVPDLALKVLSWQHVAGWCPLPSKKMGKLKELNYSKLFEIFWIRWLQERRLLDEDKMIIWKFRIAIDKMKIIIWLFDHLINSWIIKYLMAKYGSKVRVKYKKDRISKWESLKSDGQFGFLAKQ